MFGRIGSQPDRGTLRVCPRSRLCQGYERRLDRLWDGQGVRGGTLEERCGIVSRPSLSTSVFI
jgi:hypothetical protein